MAAPAVAFFGQAAGSEEPAALLNYGGGIALVQHRGIMDCLMGVFMVAAAFKEAWRVPILLYGMIEKAFMVVIL
jgi:hypothetical protein